MSITKRLMGGHRLGGVCSRQGNSMCKNLEGGPGVLRTCGLFTMAGMGSTWGWVELVAESTIPLAEALFFKPRLRHSKRFLLM